MEKTMEYALSEALEMGRRSAMPEFLEQELREKIAQEVEGFTMTWGQFNEGIPLHSNCFNCNAEPYTPVCDSSRDYFAKAIYQHIAKIVRGKNDSN